MPQDDLQSDQQSRGEVDIHYEIADHMYVDYNNDSTCLTLSTNDTKNYCFDMITLKNLCLSFRKDHISCYRNELCTAKYALNYTIWAHHLFPQNC